MNLNELTSTCNNVHYSLQARQLGNTTSLIELVRSNKNAVLVTANQHQSSDIIRANPDLQNRVISLHQMDRMRGMSFFPVFDNYALHILFDSVTENLRKLSSIKEIIGN